VFYIERIFKYFGKINYKLTDTTSQAYFSINIGK